MSDFLRIGHRGAAGYEPENTLRSFEKAIGLQCGAVEFDVHLAASGEPVVIHDCTLERTTNGSGYVSEMPLDELKKLDAGAGERIPTLEEALGLIGRRAAAHIEVKGAGALMPVLKIVERYISSEGWDYADFLVSSFDHLDLLRARERMPGLRTGALFAEAVPGLCGFAREMKAYSINIAKDAVTALLTEEARKAGIRVFAFTVNDPEEIAKIKAAGVDGIFSDFPDRL